MPKKSGLVVALILVLALVLRMVNLGNFPTGLTSDEAALGYNAYSLLKTGKDEWGVAWYKLFYTNLKSFGDYKLPLYSFLAEPSIGLLGLNALAVRLPNALVGTLAVLMVYLLALQLTQKDKIAAWSALAMAIGPWSMGLSRGAFEANLGTLFIPLGIWLWLKKQPWLGVVSFALAFYSYHSARFAVPFVILLLVWFTKEKITKKLLLVGGLTLVLVLPGVLGMLGSAGSRSKDVSIFSPTDNWQSVSDRRFKSTIYGVPDSVSRLLVNKVTYVADTLYKSAFNYFSWTFLFTSGVSEANYGLIPGRGVLYKFEIVFVLAALVVLVTNFKREYKFLSLLILVSFVPAIFAKGVGLAGNRTVIASSYIFILVGIGIEYLLEKFSRWHLGLVFFVLYVFSLGFYLHDYYYFLPVQTARAVGFGWQEMLSRIDGQTDRYKQIRIDRGLSEPQIFVAFYKKIDPDIYQKSTQSWPDFQSKGFKYLDQYSGYVVGKYYFGDLNYSPDKNPKDVLYVGKREDFTEKINEVFTINYPDGKPDIVVAQ